MHVDERERQPHERTPPRRARGSSKRAGRRRTSKRRTGSGRQTTRSASLLPAVLAFLAGAAALLYPAVSNRLAEARQAAAIEAYETAVEEVTEEDLSAYREAAEAYNASLAGDPVQDPFQTGSGYAVPAGYDELLDVNGDGIMGYIEIPSIDVCLPIYHGTSEEVLAQGAGHIETTSLPVGGAGTHAVVCAHRGLPSAALFSDLDELEEGDVFYLHVLGETLVYTVDRISVVEPDDLSELAIEPGKDYVTLLTCTPYGINTHRLLVRGTRIEGLETEEGTAAAAGARDTVGDLPLLVAGTTTALAAALAAAGTARKRKRRGGRRAVRAAARACKGSAIPPDTPSAPRAWPRRRAGPPRSCGRAPPGRSPRPAPSPTRSAG